MPIDRNAFFGPLSQAIDIVVADNLRRAREERLERTRQENIALKESQFRRSGNLQTALRLMQSGKLTPESTKAISGSISSMLSDPNFAFQPGMMQYQQPERFTTGAPEEAIGFAPGTKIPYQQAGPLIKRRTAEPKEKPLTVPLGSKIANALGLPENQQVPVEEYDSLYRAYIGKLREQRLAQPKPKTDQELSKAIDDTRIRLQTLEKQATQNPLTTGDEVLDEIDQLRQRHTDLLAQQDERVGRKGAEKKTETSANRVTTLQTMLRQGLLNEQNYKNKLRQLFQEMGGDEKAAAAIEKAMGF